MLDKNLASLSMKKPADKRFAEVFHGEAIYGDPQKTLFDIAMFIVRSEGKQPPKDRAEAFKEMSEEVDKMNLEPRR